MKKCTLFLTFAALIFMLTLPTAAAQTESGVSFPPSEWNEFNSSVPDELRDKLPEGSLDNGEGFAENVSEMSKSEYIISAILDALGLELRGAAKLFLTLTAVLMISAVFGTTAQGTENPALVSAMRFCASAAVISVAVGSLYSHFSDVEVFFGKLGTLMNGMIPVTAGIWAMGGNVSTASVGSASFYVILNVCQSLLAGSLIPVCCVLSVLGFCDAISDEIKVGRIMNAVKKIYNFILVGVMTVLVSSLAAQTAIAASADTAAAKAARLASGTLIPVVGGSVGETLRTLSGGVSYLKGLFGVGGIILIALLVLPLALSVLLTRFVFLLSGGIADMLGCSGEARLLDNLGEVYGSILAVISGVCVTFILALCIFMQTVVAVA